MEKENRKQLQRYGSGHKAEKEYAAVWQRPWALCLTAFFCTFLWGSAFPCIKAGYSLLRIEAADTSGQILFAGVRFFIAGIMVLAAGSILQRRLLIPGRREWPRILLLALFQTILQYVFFYIGLAHATGVSSSIIEASNTFFTLLTAAFVFRLEKMTARKVIGCLIGFAGVLFIEIPGSGTEWGFRMSGEGCILLSALCASLSPSLIRIYGRTSDPVLLSGWQFTVGGTVMAVLSLLTGGKLGIGQAGVPGILLLLYMAFISAGAYTMWGILLKYNPVSKVAVFGFINPVVGVLLSALLLGESGQAFSIYGVIALILVSLGIIIVNRKN